jgi:hypothetical protein
VTEAGQKQAPVRPGQILRGELADQDQAARTE